MTVRSLLAVVGLSLAATCMSGQSSVQSVAPPKSADQASKAASIASVLASRNGDLANAASRSADFLSVSSLQDNLKREGCEIPTGSIQSKLSSANGNGQLSTVDFTAATRLVDRKRATCEGACKRLAGKSRATLPQKLDDVDTFFLATLELADFEAQLLAATGADAINAAVASALDSTRVRRAASLEQRLGEFFGEPGHASSQIPSNCSLFLREGGTNPFDDPAMSDPVFADWWKNSVEQTAAGFRGSPKLPAFCSNLYEALRLYRLAEYLSLRGASSRLRAMTPGDRQLLTAA